MKQKFSFRRMKQSDKKNLIRIVKKIWPNDYIIRDFDKFTQDREGEFTAMLYGGKLVGCAKLQYLTATDAWLLALRKDPDLKVKGAAKAMSKHLLDVVSQKKDLTSVRFSTYIKNYASINANEHVGFECVQKASIKVIEIKPEDIRKEKSSHKVVKIKDTQKALAYIKKSSYFKKYHWLVNFDWIVHPYSDDLITKEFIKKGQCYGIVEDGYIKALTLNYCDSHSILVFFDAVSFEYADALMNHMKRQVLNTKELENKSIQFFAPDYKKLLSWSKRMGFKSWEFEHDFLIYEYPIDKLKKRRVRK